MNAPEWSAVQWRKSSRSTNTGGECVEVADLGWRKSNRSGDTGGQCVEVADLGWRSGSRSGDTGGACVEVAGAEVAVAVRDSKDPDGGNLVFGAGAWRAFTERVEAGAYDLG
ncbi:DUF397 domain-containing protein [Spirillospora sp. NPDC047279]|uniref:DUF397 domain-containing protein n=1 Tax=Spirillospora sp. NPDC047279 TaxID=3155478 RepID=UPI0033C917B7